MNITTIPNDFKILQKSSSYQMVRGGGSTEQGKYVRLYSSLRNNGSNSYTLSVDISTSSSGVYNGYGVRIYSHIGGSKYHIGTVTISGGVPSSRNLTHTFTVSSTVSVYASCICSYCEDGIHSSDMWNFTNQTSADTAVYTNPKPTAPILVFNSMGNSDSVGGPNGYPVYSGTKSDGSANWIKFYIGKPGEATRTKVWLQYKYSDDPTWHNAAGFPSDSGELYHYATRNFYLNDNDSDRYSNRNLLWCAWAEAYNASASTLGEYKYFYINDLPTMNANSISVSTRKTNDAVTIKWGNSSDSLATSKKFRIHLYKWNGSSYIAHRYFDTINVNESTINLSSYGFNGGEWCKVHVEPIDSLELSRSHYSNANCEVQRNSAPYFITGTTVSTSADSSKVFKDSVTLSWNAARDNENDSLSYYVYYNAQDANGNWSSSWTYISTVTSRSTTVNCQNYVNKGRRIQFYVVATDGLASSSNSISSAELTRANNPQAPTALTINPNTSDKHYESINSISWNHSYGSDGSACKYRVNMIVTRSENVNDQISNTSYDVTGSTFNTDIGNVARGNYIIFKVRAIDSLGLESESTLDSKWCRRNRAPISPKGFKVNSDKLNFFRSVPLKWEQASDPDGDNVTYKIYCNINNSGAYTEIVSGLSGTTFSHNISDTNKFRPGYTLGYKILSEDKFGIVSNETFIENNNKITVNTKPLPPVLIYPISMVYDKTPRILLQTQGDLDRDNLSIKIEINGQIFNSATSSAFNKNEFYDNQDKIVFVPPALNEGDNVFKVKTFDGYEDSTESTFVIKYSKELLSSISSTADVIITKDIDTKLNQMILNSRKAYGLSEYTPNTITPNESFVEASIFSRLYDNIAQVNSWINTNYPGLTRNKVRPQISRGVKITKDIYNNILEIITNL